jgi:hypothetical protein
MKTSSRSIGVLSQVLGKFLAQGTVNAIAPRFGDRVWREFQALTRLAIKCHGSAVQE